MARADHLPPSDRGIVARARETLTASKAMDVGAATDRDLCREIGRLQVVIESLLRVIDAEEGQ